MLPRKTTLTVPSLVLLAAVADAWEFTVYGDGECETTNRPFLFRKAVMIRSAGPNGTVLGGIWLATGKKIRGWQALVYPFQYHEFYGGTNKFVLEISSRVNVSCLRLHDLAYLSHYHRKKKRNAA